MSLAEKITGYALEVRTPNEFRVVYISGSLEMLVKMLTMIIISSSE
jgi:hypothetical protein